MDDKALSTDLYWESYQYATDPNYQSDDGSVPQVWLDADRIRSLLTQRSHTTADREALVDAVDRQVRTVEMYYVITNTVEHATTSGTLSLFLLLFPGEARDKTGLKDLNDEVLGYTLHQEYTLRRQQAIRAIFQPELVVVGQDYKTALFLSAGDRRDLFDARLRRLDAKLRDLLLNEFLPKSDKKGARDLERTLRKDPDYRFDVYYGLDATNVGPSTSDALIEVFTLLTQAMKAAAIARYLTKGESLRTRVARKFGRKTRRDRTGDGRGKAFDSGEFLRVARVCPEIKVFFLKSPKDQKAMLDYNSIYIDTVWTTAFFRTQNAANRDVVRDVRKKKLVRPPRPNIKLTFKAQRELLELWLVGLNIVDFVKDFTRSELPRELTVQHQDAVRAIDNLRTPSEAVDRVALQRLLTTDHRRVRVASLGTTSEFQFYAAAADHDSRIIFMMDVQDLGVEVLLMYDAANARIVDRRLTGGRLLDETIACTEPVTTMRRATHALVLDTFRHFHGELSRRGSTKESVRAFRVAPGQTGSFDDDVQVMLGGDEIMVSCHPRFAGHVPAIVKALSTTAPMNVVRPGAGGRTLPIRAGVSFSLARRRGRRASHQHAHHQAMRLADESHSQLKTLERTERRIERLIELLEDNPDKRPDAPRFRQQLEQLALSRHFTRIQHGRPRALPTKRFESLANALRAERISRQDKALVELVDFDGNVVDHSELTHRAHALEKRVRDRVGWDNVHVDPPPVSK